MQCWEKRVSESIKEIKLKFYQKHRKKHSNKKIGQKLILLAKIVAKIKSVQNCFLAYPNRIELVFHTVFGMKY